MLYHNNLQISNLCCKWNDTKNLVTKIQALIADQKVQKKQRKVKYAKVDKQINYNRLQLKELYRQLRVLVKANYIYRWTANEKDMYSQCSESVVDSAHRKYGRPEDEPVELVLVPTSPSDYVGLPTLVES